MSFKKRATKSIALALVGVTVATPVFNTVSAALGEGINYLYNVGRADRAYHNL